MPDGHDPALKPPPAGQRAEGDIDSFSPESARRLALRLGPFLDWHKEPGIMFPTLILGGQWTRIDWHRTYENLRLWLRRNGWYGWLMVET